MPGQGISPSRTTLIKLKRAIISVRILIQEIGAVARRMGKIPLADRMRGKAFDLGRELDLIEDELANLP